MIVTWSQAYKLAHSLAVELGYFVDPGPSYKEGILLLGRGGLAVGQLFARFYPTTLDRAIYVSVRRGVVTHEPRMWSRLQHALEDCKRIVLVDDIYDSGRTISNMRALWEPKDVRAVTLFARRNSHFPDFLRYGQIVPGRAWIDFPWESHDPEVNRASKRIPPQF